MQGSLEDDSQAITCISVGAGEAVAWPIARHWANSSLKLSILFLSILDWLLSALAVTNYFYELFSNGCGSITHVNAIVIV